MIWIAAVALLITAGLVIWNNGLKQRLIATNFAEVEPGLYRSGQISRHLIARTIQDYHIGLIVNLSTENTPDAQAEQTTAAELGVKRINFKLGGNGTGDPRVYPEAIKAIVEAKKQGTPVLVHCQAGSQRTGGVIAAYRILIEGKGNEEAFSEAKSYGHNPTDNPKLIPFVEEHLPEWKQALADEHVLPAGK